MTVQEGIYIAQTEKKREGDEFWGKKIIIGRARLDTQGFVNCSSYTRKLLLIRL